MAYGALRPVLLPLVAAALLCGSCTDEGSSAGPGGTGGAAGSTTTGGFGGLGGSSGGGAGGASTGGGGGGPSSVVVMAAGDVQDGSWSSSQQFELTAQVLDDSTFDAILGLGDMSNQGGTVEDYAELDQAWGRHKSKIWAVPGSHDGYGSGGTDIGGEAFFDYFNGSGVDIGIPSADAHAGPRGLGYFAADLGPWLVIGLNYCAESSHEFSVGDGQLTWLTDVMANKPSGQPVVVIEHTPRYTKASNHAPNEADVSLAWDILLQYQPDVRLFLAGHMNGVYERFVPMDNAGAADPDGIRSFTVATGGTGAYDPGSTDDLLEVTAQTYGVLQLTLRSDGYDWEFKPIAGETFEDTGSFSW